MFRMLIVDDDLAHCQGIDHLSKQLIPDLDTVLCDDAPQALALLRAETFQILFVDIRMPILSGLDIIEQILPVQPDLQVIVYTAHSEFAYTKRAMQLGVRHYILKPIRIGELQQELTAVLEECRANEARRFRDYVSKTYYGTCAAEEPAVSGFPCQIALIDFEQSVLSSEHAVEDLRGLLQNDLAVILLNESQMAVAGTAIDEDRLIRSLDRWTRIGYVIVSCGEVAESGRLAPALKQASDLLAFRFYMKNRRVYHLDDTLPSGWLDGRQPEELAVIAEMVNDGRYEEAEQAVTQFFAGLQSSGQRSDLYIKYLLVDWLRQFQPPEDGGDVMAASVKQILASKNPEALCSLCCEAIRRVKQERSENSGRLVIDRAIEILKAECDRNISLGQLADRVYLSPSYLSYLFKKYTGETYIKFVTGLRMKKAKDLLLRTNLKVGEIGNRVGYANISYFCILFRDFYGMSPSQFRETQIR